jgi:hypothetical protein
MNLKSMPERLGLTGGWTREPALAVLALAFGFGLMPLLIYLAGSWTLGRYEGASATGIYQGIYRGLASGSVACWIVVLGPFGLVLTFKILRLWWRASARLA